MVVCILTLVMGSLIIFLFTIKIFDTLKLKRNTKFKSPPGPWNLPFVGYMPFLAYNPQKRLQTLSKTYGEIFTIFIGNYRVVVLNSHRIIRDAFKEEIFSGRPDLMMLEVRNGGVRKGLVCSEGKDWIEQRKFTLRHLRERGFGKKSMEGLLQEELQELICGLRNVIGAPVDLKDTFNLAVLNALWSIICGHRYSHDDQQLQTILKRTSADLAETQYTGPLLFLPWLLKIAPGLTRWNDFVNSVQSVHKFLREIIATHKRTFNSSVMRDFIDVYLEEIRTTSDKESSFYKDVGEHSLLVVLLDLFMAGADTTSTTLYWAFLYMVLNQDVQKNIQTEIDNVLGNVSITLEHRKLMPYTEATILEVLRKSSLVPMGLFHSTTSDTKLMGYNIKKDTVIIANLYNLNYNQDYWGDPENFRPERFLKEKSKTLIKHDILIPFSTGRRACPGETLAKDQLFLFLVGLLQKFTFQTDLSKPRPTDNPNYGVILSPKNYSMIIQERSIKNISNN